MFCCVSGRKRPRRAGVQVRKAERDASEEGAGRPLATGPCLKAGDKEAGGTEVAVVQTKRMGG